MTMLYYSGFHGNGVQFNLANAWFARISRLGTVPHPRETRLNLCEPFYPVLLTAIFTAASYSFIWKCLITKLSRLGSVPHSRENREMV